MTKYIIEHVYPDSPKAKAVHAINNPSVESLTSAIDAYKNFDPNVIAYAKRAKLIPKFYIEDIITILSVELEIQRNKDQK